MRAVREERTGWRCEKISQRHRHWGYNCPCVDLDFVVSEYNHGKPVAIIEYKDKRAEQPNVDHPTYKALVALADGYMNGPIPCAIVFYCSDKWWFKVIPLNEIAKSYFGHVANEKISEQRFVRGLYLLRKKTLSKEDEQAISQLNSIPGAGPVHRS